LLDSGALTDVSVLVALKYSSASLIRGSYLTADEEAEPPEQEVNDADAKKAYQIAIASGECGPTPFIY
jgi:hypothetical protein